MKAPGDELQKMPHSKARTFKPQARLEPAQLQSFIVFLILKGQSLPTESDGSVFKNTGEGTQLYPAISYPVPFISLHKLLGFTCEA